MRCLISLTSLVLALGTASAAADSWRLVWSDEFDGAGLPDATRWSYDVGGGGWGNAESQFYTDKRTENARQEGGHLVIEARRESWESRSYTSARLVTRGKGDWLYGRVEVRALLPKGRGVWPAIWLLPTDWKYGDWPKSGELDIMENVGYDPDRIHSNIHTQAYNHSIGTNKGNNRLVSSPSENWHVYRMDWYPDRVEYYIDDEVLFVFRNEGTGSAVWPFDQRFHLILNIAVGGSWGGSQGIDDVIFPQSMRVDWVRVYQQDENAPTTLTTKTVGQGRVEVSPAKASWERTETARASAVPATGWTFARWAGGGTRADTSVSMSADRNLEAWFRPANDLLVDGEFAAGGAGWDGPNYLGTASGSGSRSGGAVKAGVVSGGTERWNVQLLQSGFGLETGRTYAVRFTAKASVARSIDVSVEHDASPWTSHSRRLLELGTEAKPFSWTFRMDGESDPAARLVFNLGLEAGDVTLDDVRLEVLDPTAVGRRDGTASRGRIQVHTLDGRRVGALDLGAGESLPRRLREVFGQGTWIVRDGDRSRLVAAPSDR